VELPRHARRLCETTPERRFLCNASLYNNRYIVFVKDMMHEQKAARGTTLIEISIEN
jgi:hypothetical protein